MFHIHVKPPESEQRKRLNSILKLGRDLKAGLLNNIFCFLQSDHNFILGPS